MSQHPEPSAATSGGLPTPVFDLMFCLIAVLILSLSLVFRNRPNTEATASAVLLPRAAAPGGSGGGAHRVTVAVGPGTHGAALFSVAEQPLASLEEVRSRLRQLSPAAIVISIDTRTAPDPLTVAIRLLQIARDLGIPAHLAYRPDGEGGGLR